MITVNLFAPLISCLVTFSLFVYVRAQRQRNDVNLRFEFFSAAISLAAFCDFALRLQLTLNASYIVAHCAVSLMLTLSIFFLDFVYALLGRRPDAFLRVMRPAAFVALASPFILYNRLFEVVNIDGALMIRPQVLLVPLFVVFCAVPGFYATYLCWNAIRREKRVLAKKRLVLLFWGTITSLSFESIVLVLVPLISGSYTLTQYSSFGVVIQALFIYYAIYKYHLFQVNLEQVERVSKYLFENVHDGVVLFDREGKLIQINAAAMELVNTQAPERITEKLSRCIADYDINREYRDLKTTCTVDGGLPRVVLVSQTAISLSEDLPAVILIIRDITDQVKLEQELQKIHQIESIGLLAAGIAHDFNNFLTGIITSFGLVKDTLPPTDERHAILAEAESAIKRATHLTAQLLTFSRGGGMDKTFFSVRELIEEVMRFCLRGRADIRFENYIFGNTCMVEADRSQISRVFQNLAVNAADAMPHGGTITVTGSNLSIDAGSLFPLLQGEHVEITVADTGIGIPEAFISKIFDPYFTTKSNGMGLGLTTAFSIVNKHGGHITVSSELGQGTTFTVYLKAASPAAAVDRITSGVADLKGDGRKLLIMDDDPVIRLLLKQVLNKIGFDVDAAEEGNQALSMYDALAQRNEKYAAAIVDLTVLKGMGGIELTRGLLSREPSMKIIVASGYSQDPVITSYRDYGFCAAMKKPYGIEEIRSVLASVLKEG